MVSSLPYGPLSICDERIRNPFSFSGRSFRMYHLPNGKGGRKRWREERATSGDGGGGGRVAGPVAWSNWFVILNPLTLSLSLLKKNSSLSCVRILPKVYNFYTVIFSIFHLSSVAFSRSVTHKRMIFVFVVFRVSFSPLSPLLLCPSPLLYLPRTPPPPSPFLKFIFCFVVFFGGAGGGIGWISNSISSITWRVYLREQIIFNIYKRALYIIHNLYPYIYLCI